MDFSKINYTNQNNAYYGIDADGNYYTDESQSRSSFKLLPVVYNIQDESVVETDQLANVILEGYMNIDQNVKIPDADSSLNMLTRYSRIATGTYFKSYSYKDLGYILDMIYTSVASSSSDSSANTKAIIELQAKEAVQDSSIATLSEKLEWVVIE